MKAVLFSIVLAGSLAGPHAHANTLPPLEGQSQAVGSDERIRTVVYSGEVAVRLWVGPYPALIELEPGEVILDIASSDTGDPAHAWEIEWRAGQNYLFVRPRTGCQPGSMTIKTAAHAYVFDLLPDLDASLFDRGRTARLSVSLPHPSAEDGAKSTDQAAAENRSALTHRRNVAYTLEVVTESEDIRPREVFDDGRFTYMRFPNNLMIPAIYKSVPFSGEEHLINSHMEGDWVVLEGIAPLWNLRLGGSMVGVFNERFETEGVPPAEGTTVPGVVRRIK